MSIFTLTFCAMNSFEITRNCVNIFGGKEREFFCKKSESRNSII